MNKRQVGWWVFVLVLACGLARPGFGRQEADPAADAERTVDLSQLNFRQMAPRPDKTIFSPLELPAPNRLRTAAGLPGEDYWQQRADYRIEVALDAENESIRGSERVLYTNNSPHDLSYVWITLEQNIFRENSDGSKFTPPGSRFNNRQVFAGGVDVEFVRCGGQELKLSVYDTVGRIELTQPVAARGGQLELEIGWKFNVPDYGVDRMGIRRVEQGKVFQLAQWFPAICKFDDVHGWNTLPYLGQGEFYTDFGTYEVAITAPANHVVCATGALQNPEQVLSESQMRLWTLAHASKATVVIRGEEELGQALPADAPAKTWRFRAENVRSYAWTSSDATIWDAAAIDWGDGQSVLVQSVYPLEARAAWTESTQMLRHSILHYSQQWFRYPYPAATNVNGNVGGMEYPMIIFCGGDSNKRGLFSVTSHEIGHNWFPMTVNTDERRFAWMDEGFNTFINAYDLYEDYQTQVNGAEPPARRAQFSARGISRMLGRSEMQPVDLPADQLRPELLGALAYNKTGVALRMLREVVLGPERFDLAFQEYIRAWAFKSPQPADFFRCMENGAGADLAWFWRGWLTENCALDQGVVDLVESQRSPRARIQLANFDQMVMPVQLQIDFEDGTSLRHDLPVYIWYYTNVWTTEIDTQGKKIVKVTVDPNRILPDSDRRNNVWQAKPADSAPENPPPADEDSQVDD